MMMAQSIDVRPRIAGNYKIKFKIELMPLKERIGGVRRLLSHNVEFGLSQAPEADALAMSSLGHMSLPELQQLFPPLDDRSRATVRIRRRRWSTSASSRSCCRTSASSISAITPAPPPISPCGARAATIIPSSANSPTSSASTAPTPSAPRPLHACERFFVELQQTAADWLALTTTKTGAVYRLKGNPPQAHE